MNPYERLDTRPCFKCKERHLLCHSECERYAAYKTMLNRFNAEKRKRENFTRKHWTKEHGKWVKVR